MAGSKEVLVPLDVCAIVMVWSSWGGGGWVLYSIHLQSHIDGHAIATRENKHENDAFKLSVMSELRS
jgi:hypothetical protein